MFPLDLFKVTSLYLLPGKLSICHVLHNMYDNNWYYNKLKLIYPIFNFDSFVDYKLLYEKSRNQGTFYKYINDDLTAHIELPVCGIKIARVINGEMILTFNGDLWIILSGYKPYLQDTDVTDICAFCYIKGNELYTVYQYTCNYPVNRKLYNEIRNIKHYLFFQFTDESFLQDDKESIIFQSAVFSNESFISITSNDEYITAITHKNIYCLMTGDNEKDGSELLILDADTFLKNHSFSEMRAFLPNVELIKIVENYRGFIISYYENTHMKFAIFDPPYERILTYDLGNIIDIYPGIIICETDTINVIIGDAYDDEYQYLGIKVTFITLNEHVRASSIGGSPSKKLLLTNNEIIGGQCYNNRNIKYINTYINETYWCNKLPNNELVEMLNTPYDIYKNFKLDVNVSPKNLYAFNDTIYFLV